MPNEIANPASVYPWTEIDRAFDAVRRQLFDGFRLPSPTNAAAASGYLRTARLDVEETDHAYRLRVEVPGIPKENLGITVRGTEVEIRGEFTQEKEPKEPNWVHRERTYVGFYRSLELPEPVVGTQATAVVENGVLTLELPKEHPEPTPTEVKVSVA